MRILHVSRHHWSYALGGTEVYLRDLVVALRERGHEVPVLTFQESSARPNDVDPSSCPLPTLEEVGEAELRRRASAYIEEAPPALGHFHSLKLEELVVAKELARRAIPYIVTYHHPGLSCYRGDLLRWGSEVCDGRVEVWKCAACRVANRTGLPRPASYAMAAAIGVASPALEWMLSRGLHAKLDYWASTAGRARLVRDFLGGCSTVVACTPWSVDVMRRNEVDGGRVRLVPQGLPSGIESMVGPHLPPGRDTVNVGFVGRICREKGPDLLVEAMRRVPHGNLRLLVVGWDSDPRHPLEPRLRERSQGDERIRFLGRLDPAQTRGLYADLDFLAVPSIWLETGPLVVWEALSFGVPVLASKRIGHPALLDGGRGMIVEPNSVERWAAVLTEAAEGRLDLSVRPGTKLRTMYDVAADLEALYASIPASPGSPSTGAS